MYVLVVEDNLVNQKVAQHMLEKLGCRVDIARDGQEAIEKIDRERYDVVFMDCQMPGMDGYTATAEIRRRQDGKRRLPVVAMTANASRDDRQKCLDVGMDDYIEKPVKIHALGQAISRWAEPASESVRDDVDGPVAGASLDSEVIEGLRLMADEDDPGFLEELFDTFVGNAATTIELLREAAGSGDAQSLAKAAHSLKGSSGNVGARGMFEKCRDLESIGKTRQMDGSRELVDEIEAEFARVKVDLKPALVGQR